MFLFLPLAMLFSASSAQAAEPEVYEHGDMGGCGRGRGSVLETDLKIPVPNAKFSFPHAILTQLGKDMLRFDKAVNELYELDSAIVAVVSPYCEVSGFEEMLSIHQKAFEDRKNEDLGHFDEKLIQWVSPQDALLDAKTSFPDYYGLETVCRPPNMPPKLKLAVAPGAMSEENKKNLAGLNKDIRDFYNLQLKQHKTITELMRLEQGFRCREVIMAYYPLKGTQYARFWDHRNAELARIAESSLQWEVIP
jgi:hypothetical protein